MQAKKHPHLYLTFAMILVGTSAVVSKLLIESLPIFFTSFVSLLIASILFLPLLIREKAFSKLNKTDFYYLSLQALLGTILYRVSLFVGLKFINPSYAEILSAIQPAMISLFAFMYLKEKQSFKQIAGISLAIVGILITYVSNSLRINLGYRVLIGTILILLSIVGEACFSIFAKKIRPNINPLIIAGIVTVLSTIFMIPLAVLDLMNFGIPHFNLMNVSMLIYYGIFLTYLTFILWFKGLENVKAGVAGIFTALDPVSGLFFSALILKDIPSIPEIFGTFVIIVSIIFVVYKIE